MKKSSHSKSHGAGTPGQPGGKPDDMHCRPGAPHAERPLAVDLETTLTALCVRLGPFLERVRMGMGLERADIAGRGNMGDTTVCDTERKKTRGSLEAAKRYAYALGAQLWMLILIVEMQEHDPEEAMGRGPVSPVEFLRMIVRALAMLPRTLLPRFASAGGRAGGSARRRGERGR